MTIIINLQEIAHTSISQIYLSNNRVRKFYYHSKLMEFFKLNTNQIKQFIHDEYKKLKIVDKISENSLSPYLDQYYIEMNYLGKDTLANVLSSSKNAKLIQNWIMLSIQLFNSMPYVPIDNLVYQHNMSMLADLKVAGIKYSGILKKNYNGLVYRDTHGDLRPENIFLYKRKLVPIDPIALPNNCWSKCTIELEIAWSLIYAMYLGFDYHQFIKDVQLNKKYLKIAMLSRLATILKLIKINPLTLHPYFRNKNKWYLLYKKLLSYE